MPTRKAKPAGVLGAEIWVNILPVGQPTPTDPASFTFVALDTRTPYTLDFAGADGGLPLTRRGGRTIFHCLPSAKRLRRVKGKNANYLLRWVNRIGQKEPPALDGTPHMIAVSKDSSLRASPC